MLKTLQVWTGTFPTLDATGALATPSVGPVGTLYVAGVANAAVVTISGANPYKYSVTLPALTAGQSVEMYVTATIAGIATSTVVDKDIADTVALSDLATPTNITAGTINSVSGTVNANLVSILGTAITETAGLVAAAFSKFFNKAAPTGTVNSLPDAVAGATGGLPLTDAQGVKLSATQGAVEFAGQVKITANVAGPTEGVLDIRNSGTGSAVYLRSESGHTVFMDQKASTTAAGLFVRSYGTGVFIASVKDNALEITSDSAEGVSIIGYLRGIYVSAETQEGVRIESAALDKAALSIRHYSKAGQGILVQSVVSGEGIKVIGAGAFHDIDLAGDGVLDGDLGGKVLGGGAGVFVADGVQVAASGGTGLTAQETRDAMKLAPTAGTPAAGSVDKHLDDLLTYGGGSGTGTYTDTITDGTNPIDGVCVQLSTDSAGVNRVYEAFTNASGVFTMNPDPGTYYRWLDLAGYSFTQGAAVVVT